MTRRGENAAAGATDRKVVEAYLNAGHAVFYTMTLSPGSARADWVSPNVFEILGYTPEEALVPGWWWTHLDEAMRPGVVAANEHLVATGALIHQYRFRKKSGEWIWVLDDLRIVERRPDGTSTVIGTWVDITEAKRREAKLALALEVSEVGLFELEFDTQTVSTNDQYARMLGLAPESFRLSDEVWRDRLHPEDRERAVAAYEDYVAGRTSEYRNEFRMRTESSDYLWILSVGRITERHPDGRPARMIGTHTDITAIKSSIEQSRLREELLDQLGVGVVMCDGEGRLKVFNRVAQEWHGASPDPGLAPTVWAERYDLFAWDGRTRLRPEQVPLARAFAGEVVRDAPMAIKRGRHLRFVRANAAPLLDSDGRRIGALAVMHDVTALIDSEVMLKLQRAALEAAANAIVITDREGIILWANQAFTALTGYTLDETRGKNPRSLVKSDRTPREVYVSMWETILAGQVWSGEVINRRKDGSHYPEALTISPVVGEDGQATHFVAIKRDLTEERELAVRMHQSEKMESIGRLAGGVAHDFNNLLTVINGGLDLALEELGEGHAKLRHELEEVRHASERATTLTRQLLAFGRQQVLRTEQVRLKVVVGELLRMLERLLGERIVISAQLDGVGRVLVDKGQLEQVIVNLVVNARDAMPDGGTLTITAEERLVRPSEVPGLVQDARVVEPDRPRSCAILRITDTGHGMDAEVLEHLFEPFFTTKPLGHGTGLGLPMVYGIVAQSGGFMSVESTVGQGSSFAIYLPLVVEEDLRPETDRVSRPPPRIEQPRAMASSSQKAILLVDDEDSLRRVSTRILKKAGYEVLAASGGEEALSLCAARNHPVDLVITDVVMPKMTGSELVARLAGLCPGVSVIYTSGYNTDMVVRHGVASDRVHFIPKPYSASALLELIAKVLAERVGP